MPGRPLLLCALFTLVSPLYGQTAALSVPDQTLTAGQAVVASLSLASAGQAIAAIQFDLQWDQPLAVEATAGDQVRSASKIPYVAVPGSQTVRFLVTGVNQTTIADGELLKLFLSVDPASPTSTAQIRIANAMASDPNGVSIPLNAAAANVQIAQNPNPTAVQVIPAAAVLNSASLAPGPLSPGEIITLVGFSGLPSVSLQIDGMSAPVLYAGSNQINAIVPFGLDLTHAASLQLKTPAQTSAMSLPVAPTSPAIFTLSSTGLGSGAILNQDNTVNSFDNPASPGSIIMIYGTGFGLLQSPVIDGQAVVTQNFTVLPVSATVAGLQADVVYAGAAPGLIAGVIQINVRLPAGLAHDLTAPLVLTVSGSSTIGGVIAAIQ